MNDPNKAIDVNLSCLFSLKAELLKKQQEVKLAKATKPTPSEFKSKESFKLKSRKPDTEVSRTDEATVYESEDYVQLEKSRRVLEAKSKFYAQMSRSGGSLNTDDNCLVMFNRKKQEEEELQPINHQPRERLSSSSSDSSRADGDEEEEVEYVDCLGRTRKCLRKDVEEAKRRDNQLAESMPERLDQTKANWMINVHINTTEDNDSEKSAPGFKTPAPPESVYSEALSTMTKHDEQRMNWEQKEQENFEKPDVHYQDVFFDEARTHGVGYYAFSTDEKERQEQQRELEKARQTTADEQKRREEIRAKRDGLVADRVLAAKNRIRARKGLPPISKEELAKLKEIDTEIEDLKMKQSPKQIEADQKREAEEAEREKLRKEHVRDWDKDKKDCKEQRAVSNNDQDEKNEVPWRYKAERLPLSQEQWNEKQRALRPKEFAPLMEPTPKRTNFTSLPTSFGQSDSEFANFHSTKREKQLRRRNYLAATAEDEEPSTSGNNQGSHAKPSQADLDFGPSTSNSQGDAAIPPPSDLDLDPSTSKRSKTQDDLERSIEAGLKFLRKYCDMGTLGNKETWAAKADY